MLAFAPVFFRVYVSATDIERMRSICEMSVRRVGFLLLLTREDSWDHLADAQHLRDDPTLLFSKTHNYIH